MFGIRKWEPKIFKTETIAASSAILALCAYYFAWPVEVLGAATVIAGYIVGWLTIKPSS